MAIGSIGGVDPVSALRSSMTEALGAAGSSGASESSGIETPSIATGGLGATAPGAGATGAASGGGSFVDALADATRGLNSELVGADAAMASFAAGGSADLHSVILQMQEASLQMKLGVQVRDKLLEAYQDIMRLQV